MNKHIREIVYKKFKGCCSYCGDKIVYRNMQVDHMIPQSNYKYDTANERIKDIRIPNFLKHLTEGDVDHIDNLYPACRKCNKFKDNFTLEIFRRELSLQLERAFKTSSNYRRALRFNQVIESPKPIVFHFEKILDEPENYTTVMTKNSELEDEMFGFLDWYQKAPLDGKNQQEIIDIYLNKVRKEN